MAKPYKEGRGWAIRFRHKNQDHYLSGFETEAAARKSAAEKKRAIDQAGRPAGFGPGRTSVAQALQDYARERLPSLDGASQDAARINRYLRCVGLDLVQVTKLDNPDGARCRVTLVECSEERTVVPSLRKHRDAQSERTRKSDQLRAKLARTMMADVTAHQVQQLLDAMRDDGYKTASFGQERALIRVLFNYARHTWYWGEPLVNPASGRKLPKLNNRRERVISNAEWDRIIAALKRAKNRHVMPALGLLLVTAMRVGEALITARWQDVDLDRCILRLRRAKAGARDVPLSPEAVEILRQLKARAGDPDPTARILPLTYETIKAAWNRACTSAGVEDAQIHDLRHTSATRYAIEYHGNMPVLKRITGHLTDAMVNHYVHITADDVVRMMHGRPGSEADAPAGLSAEKLDALFERKAEPARGNVVKVNFGRKAA